MRLTWLPDPLAVARFAPQASRAAIDWFRGLLETVQPPEAPPDRPFLIALTVTDEEITIVAPETTLGRWMDPPAASADRAVERGFLAARVDGVLDFSIVGLLARLSAALREAEIPVFACSTYQTDYLLVRADSAARAAAALRGAGFEIDDPDSGSAAPARP